MGERAFRVHRAITRRHSKNRCVVSHRSKYLHIPTKGDEWHAKTPTTLRDTYHVLQDGRHSLRIESSWSKGYGACNAGLTLVDFVYRIG